MKKKWKTDENMLVLTVAKIAKSQVHSALVIHLKGLL